MDPDEGNLRPDNPDHNIDVLLFDLVRVCSIVSPRSAQDADTGSDDTNHGRNRMKRYRKMLLQFGNQFSNRKGFRPDKMTKDFPPDSRLILREVGPETALNNVPDL